MCTRAHKRRAGASHAGALRRQRGAALLILLMLISLGVGALLMNVYGGTDRTRRQGEAMQTLAEAQDALLGYALTHGRLPRPALSAEAGIEDPVPCDSEQRCTGYLPWATLSLKPMYARGQPLRYSVTPAFAGSSPSLSTAVATKTISWRSENHFQYRWGGPRCALGAQCLPAVIIAPGKYQAAVGAEVGDQAVNAKASIHFIQRPLTDDEHAAGAAYDDLLAWIPYVALRARMISAGSWQ